MRKSIRAVTGLTAGLLLAVGGASASASADVNTDLVNKAVVWVDSNWEGRITIPFKDGTSKTYGAKTKSYCTGFFISGDAEVATAGHCLEPDRDIEVALIKKFIAENELNIQTPPENLNWTVEVGLPTVYVGQPNIANGGPPRARIRSWLRCSPGCPST